MAFPSASGGAQVQVRLRHVLEAQLQIKNVYSLQHIFPTEPGRSSTVKKTEKGHGDITRDAMEFPHPPPGLDRVPKDQVQV